MTLGPDAGQIKYSVFGSGTGGSVTTILTTISLSGINYSCAIQTKNIPSDLVEKFCPDCV
jgi:hypothetical protein